MRIALAAVLLLSLPALAQDLGGESMLSGSMSSRAMGDGFAQQSGAGSVAATCGSPPGAPSLLLDSRNIDGSNNATLANNDPVATWTNLGTVGDSPTQGTGGLQPTYVTGCIGSLPCVRFDGGDRLASATASNWTFLHTSAGSTIISVVKVAAFAATQVIVGTSTGGSSSRGAVHRLSTSARASLFMSDGTAGQISITTSVSSFPTSQFSILATKIEDATPAGSVWIDAAGPTTGGVPTFSALDPAGPINVGATSAGGSALAGDLVVIIAYASPLDDTARAAVETWIECVWGEMPQ